MEQLKLGKIVNTYGLKGELKLLLDPQYSDIELKSKAQVNIAEKAYELLAYRKKKNTVVFSLKDLHDINQVEEFKGELIVIKQSELKKRAKNDYYGFQLLGLKVIDQEEELIGEIIRVENTGYQRLLRVKREKGKEALIPWVDFFVKEIEMKAKVVKIETIEGLL